MSSYRKIQQYNKGEWAELYVLARVLCEKAISVGRYSATTTRHDLEVLTVSRSDEQFAQFSFEDDHVVLESSGNRISRLILGDLLEKFLPEIIVGDWVFTSDTGQQLLDLLEIIQLKEGTQKSDLFLSLRDPTSGIIGRQGYSVKSFIGSTPTLLNASTITNFTYKITPVIADSKIAELQSLAIRKMCNRLRLDGYSFELVHLEQEFETNLLMVDSRMVEILSHSLLAYYTMEGGRDTRVDSIVDFLESSNPMSVRNPGFFYRHKWKDFLEASAYGLTPSRPWDGLKTAPGGLIVVDKSGDLTCMPGGSSDDHREFLIRSTKFDTASRKRHRFGKLHSFAGDFLVKLNLQIRYV